MVKWLCEYKEKNQCGPYFLVEWSCTKERINERRPHIFVEWSRAHEKNKSLVTMYFCRMVLEHGGSISPSSFYGQLPGLLVTRFSSYLPSGWVLLQENEDLESVWKIWCEFGLQLHGIGNSRCIRKWLRFDQTK